MLASSSNKSSSSGRAFNPKRTVQPQSVLRTSRFNGESSVAKPSKRDSKKPRSRKDASGKRVNTSHWFDSKDLLRYFGIKEGDAKLVQAFLSLKVLKKLRRRGQSFRNQLLTTITKHLMSVAASRFQRVSHCSEVMPPWTIPIALRSVHSFTRSRHTCETLREKGR